MVASDGTWCGFAARARVLLVNTKLIANPNEYPRSVDELADPKWSKQCAMARPLFGTTATHFAVIRERAGRDATIEQLKAIRDNAVILSGNKQVAQAVAAGTVAWGLTDTDDAIIEKDLGRNVAIVFPDQAPDQPGTLRIPNTVAVLKAAPHKVAAGMLADYLVRPDTEERLAMGDSSQIPLSRTREIPAASVTRGTGPMDASRLRKGRRRLDRVGIGTAKNISVDTPRWNAPGFVLATCEKVLSTFNRFAMKRFSGQSIQVPMRSGESLQVRSANHLKTRLFD